MSPTIYCKYKYFHSAVQTAEDGRQKFQFCRLPSDVTSCLISLFISNTELCAWKYGQTALSRMIGISVFSIETETKKKTKK